MAPIFFASAGPNLTLGRKLREINWGLIILLSLVASVGFAVLYSAAGGSIHPWAAKQMIRFAMGIGLMILVALVDTRIWMRYAYVFYLVALLLLASVQIFGRVGMGAQRWLDLGFIQLQPSEVMKIALVLALARYFHGLSDDEIGRVRNLIVPTVIALAPAALVLKQPDLGTAAILLMTAAGVFFVAGVLWWKFALLAIAGVAAAPFAWTFLHDYQKRRVTIFLNPESDPLGAGYHILQSKIALGSGGLFGKGFLNGTQSHLNFLPEKQTDFIFTSLAEEFGLMGALVLLGLYVLLIAFAYAIGTRARNQFNRLLALGFATMLFLYVFLNVAMVSALIPVVGVPLPLVSYGGTAMITLLVGFGLLMGVDIHRDVEVPRHTAGLLS
jgi:rod shape determining protein RodA